MNEKFKLYAKYSDKLFKQSYFEQIKLSKLDYAKISFILRKEIEERFMKKMVSPYTLINCLTISKYGDLLIEKSDKYTELVQQAKTVQHNFYKEKQALNKELVEYLLDLEQLSIDKKESVKFILPELALVNVRIPNTIYILDNHVVYCPEHPVLTLTDKQNRKKCYSVLFDQSMNQEIDYTFYKEKDLILLPTLKMTKETYLKIIDLGVSLTPNITNKQALIKHIQDIEKEEE